MVLVEGAHCADVMQRCLHFLDPDPYDALRCAEYARPTICKGSSTHARFCIDREEFSDSPEDPSALPTVNKTWGEAKTLCEARGA